MLLHSEATKQEDGGGALRRASKSDTGTTVLETKIPTESGKKADGVVQNGKGTSKGGTPKSGGALRSLLRQRSPRFFGMKPSKSTSELSG